MPLEDYLEAVFDEKISVGIYENYMLLPLFLKNEYSFYACHLHGIDCVLLKLNSERILIDKLQKHFLKLKEYGIEKPILVFEDLRVSQRRKLISSRIPFIVPNRQIYLPFICLDVNERIVTQVMKLVKFNTTTQLVYIYLLHSKRREVQTKTLSIELGIAYASANRAIRQLVSVGLIIESGASTRKQYHRLKKSILWNQGKVYLTSPVQHVLFIKSLPQDIKVYLSADSALAEKSMLAEPKVSTYAISKSNARLIEKNAIQSERDFETEACCKVEVWRYDPGLFATHNLIDLYSLYALYLDQEDPRIGIELDRLLVEALCED